MRSLCPRCHNEIALRGNPVVVGQTLCAACRDQSHHWQFPGSVGLGEKRLPLRGAWFKEYSNGFEVGAAMGAPMKLLLVPFACLWIAGSAGLFLKSVVSGPGSDLWLRGCVLALVAGAVYFGGIGIFSTWGRVVIRRRGDWGEVFSGLGRVGYRRRFKWSQVQSMRVYQRYGVFYCDQIALQGARTIHFGSRLGRRELNFMLGALRQFDRKRHPMREVVIAFPRSLLKY